MISIPAVLTYLKGSKAYIALFWTFLFHLTINETQLKTNNDSTDLTDNIPWTTQHTPSSTVTNWLWSLMHLEKIISRGFEMDSPKFPSWPMTCCDGWFFWDPAEGDGSVGCRLWHWGASLSSSGRQCSVSTREWSFKVEWRTVSEHGLQTGQPHPNWSRMQLTDDVLLEFNSSVWKEHVICFTHKRHLHIPFSSIFS